MPPRTRADHLTAEQLTELSTAITEGRRATVYLVEGIPSLGLEPGTSARAVSVSGTTVMVRPKGVDDELPFETDELRLTREPAGRSRTASKPAQKAAPSPRTPAAKAPAPAVKAPAPAAKAPAAKTPAPAVKAPAPAAKETTPVTNPPAPAESAAAKTRPARRPAKKQPAITITVTIDPDNEWTVAVAHGARKVAKPAVVAPDAVERAVRELADPTAVEAVESVIDAARRAAEERVARLSAELEEARKALESLGSVTGNDPQL